MPRAHLGWTCKGKVMCCAVLCQSVGEENVFITSSVLQMTMSVITIDFFMLIIENYH